MMVQMRAGSLKHVRQAGFTLVEAAIVLVVIGLILGVVLQGQSMIRNAEYRSFKSDLTDYQSAFYAFRDRYNALPGDFVNASGRIDSGLPDGDGNGVIDNGPTCNNDGDESCMAWQHLRGAGFVKGSASDAGSDASPRHPYGGVFSSFFTGPEGATGFASKMFITDLPGDIAQRLDDDLDDGEADAGRVSCFQGGSVCSDYPDADERTGVIIAL